MIVRGAQPPDFEAIRALLIAAFDGTGEADLVEQLRRDGDAEIELVAEEGGRIAGHILFSPMAQPERTLALAPVAVLPERHGSGIGSRLIRAGHDLVRSRGWTAVFGLGEPGYYRRFGYDPALAEPFDSPYAGPYFMAFRLDDSVPLGGGPARHAPAFQALEG